MKAHIELQPSSMLNNGIGSGVLVRQSETLPFRAIGH